jgi:hypothetical protein
MCTQESGERAIESAPPPTPPPPKMMTSLEITPPPPSAPREMKGWQLLQLPV